MMTLNKLCFLLALLAIAQSQKCESVNEYALLFPSVNEKMKWSITQNFMTGLDMVYTLTPAQKIFGIDNALKEADNAVVYIKSVKIVDVDSYKQPVNGAWLNGHAILDVQDGQSNVLWAQGSAIASAGTPKFNVVTPVFVNKPGYKCFSLSFIDQDNVVVDCADASGDKLVNYFYIIKKDQLSPPEGLKNTNLQGLKSSITGKRLMQQRIIVNTDTGKQTKYFFRGVPSYANPDTQGNSLIEVFALDSNNNPYKIKSYLDAATLAVLVSAKTKPFSFDLVDLQIDGDGHIFVLDAYNGVYILEWTADGIWHLTAHIPSKGGKAFGLAQNMLITLYGDFVHHCAVLYYDYFVLYEIKDDGLFQELTVYDLQFQIVDFNDKFYFGINQDKILVRNNENLYLYSINSVDLVTQITNQLNIQKMIMNPYEPNFVILTDAAAQTFSVSDSYLTLQQNTATASRQSITLQGTSRLQGKTTVCTVQIEFQILSEDDTAIYNNKRNDYTPFGDLLVYPPKDHFKLTDWVSGPIVTFETQGQAVESNQAFLGVNDDPQPDVTLKQLELLELTITATNFPDASKVVYADILTKSADPNLFYLFLQTSDLKITLWSCQIEDTLIPNGRLSCHDPLELGSSSLTLTKETYQTWFFFDQITFAFLKTNYILEAYTTDDGKPPVKSFSIEYPTDEANSISSFTFVQNFLYIVQQNSRVIKIYKTLDPFPLMLTIDNGMIVSQGYTGEWKPIRVFGNKQLKPTLIFIDNGINIFVADYHDGEFTLFSQIDYKQKNSIARVAIAESSFFVAEAGSDGSQINEYDYQDINNILWLKKVSLFNKFTISSPLQSDFSDDNGYLFIKTLYNTKTAILVITPAEMQHNSLYTYIQMSTATTTSNANTIFTLGGDDTMFVYFNDGGVHKFYTLFKEQKLAVIPSPKSNSFVSSITLKLQAKSIGGDILKFQDKTMTVLNTMSNVELDQEAFNKNSNNLLKVNNKEEFLELDDTWFTGQVGKFSVECDSCGKNLFIANKVNNSMPIIGERAVQDIANFSALGQHIIQTADALFFANANFQLAQAPILLDIQADLFICYKVTASSDGSYVVSICASNELTVAYITSCVGWGQCFPLAKAITLDGIRQVSRVEMVENSLIILDTTGYISAYTFDFTLDEWTVTLDLTIDATTFNVAKLAIGDFTIQKVSTDSDTIYKLFLTDLEFGLRVVDLTYAKNKLGMNVNKSSLDLTQWLKSVQQYTYEDTQFLSVRVYDSAPPQNNVLLVSIIFTTNNVAHYGVQLTFDFTSPSQGSVLKSQQLVYIINRYGNWDAAVGLSVQNHYFAIPYQSEESRFISVYKLPVAKLSINDDPAAPILLTMLGGDNLSGTQTPFYMVSNGVDVTPTLFVGQDTGANGYVVNDKVRLQVLGGDNVKTQKMVVTASNDFSSAQATTSVNGYSTSSSSSSKWWIWVIVVIAAVIVIGIIGYCIYKSKNKVNDEPLIVNQGN